LADWQTEGLNMGIQTQATAAAAPAIAPLSQGPDWLLQHLVALVTDGPLEIGMTLQVGGFLVSGKLVSGARYFEGIASDFAHGLAAYPQVAQSVRASFEEFGKLIYEGNAGPSARPLPHYIHLTDTKFFSTAGEPVPAGKGVWWRGRISEVGGFALGQLQSQA
jgi:hypothetical protein